MKAVARVLACLFYRLLTKGQTWVDRGTVEFELRRTAGFAALRTLRSARRADPPPSRQLRETKNLERYALSFGERVVAVGGRMRGLSGLQFVKELASRSQCQTSSLLAKIIDQYQIVHLLVQTREKQLPAVA